LNFAKTKNKLTSRALKGFSTSLHVRPDASIPDDVNNTSTVNDTYQFLAFCLYGCVAKATGTYLYITALEA